LSTLHTKICIVGAGPAGATTSIFLGKENIPHIIIDAASFPRDKICGDGLDMKAITVLNHIDKSILEQEMGIGGNFVASWGFRIINTKGKHTNFVYQPKAEGSPPPYGVCKRFFFDNLLIPLKQHLFCRKQK
jgi:2-polyprenyl-6-methoxyphenol hydroxylase-like FAD-dependent oxidoreductase